MLNRGILSRHESMIDFLQKSSDALLAFALLPYICMTFNVTYGQKYQIAALLAALLTWLLMGAVDAYRPWRSGKIWLEIRTILTGWLLVVIVLIFVAWLLKASEAYSRYVIATWFLLTPLIIISFHIAYRALLRQMRLLGYNARSATVIGTGSIAVQLAEKIHAAPWMGIHLHGMFGKNDPKRVPNHLTVLGDIDQAVDYIEQHHIEYVYLALPRSMESKMIEIKNKLGNTTACIFLVPDVLVFDLLNLHLYEVDGLPILALCESPFFGPFGILKRIEDITLSILIILFIAPVLIGVAIGVKVTSPGPVIFKQRRFGLNGQEFKVWKFRTMRSSDDGDDIPQATKNDSRVTPFGAFLRRTSLDELPQFFNVLQGHMSIVGPRPHAVAHNKQYRKLIKDYMWRHKVKPGITGWAQINGWRGETDTLHKMEKRVEYDLEYIRHWSLALDMKIIILTVFKGFTGKNAY